jgi:hypothetical protein
VYITKGCGALAVAPRILSVQSALHAPRGRLRTVPPELPRGSGDAALASPVVVPKFGKYPCLECRVWHRKTITFCLLDVFGYMRKKYKEILDKQVVM